MLPALLLLLQASVSPPDYTRILSRVSEEAEMLRVNAPKSLTEERLQQRALRPPSRFRPRTPETATNTSAAAFQTREIVSEYSVGTLRQSDSGRLMEFRQVVSVDGRSIQTVESARHALTLGLSSGEDRARKRMLEDYERHGLVGAVSDFGILLLLFTRREATNYTITPMGGSFVGTDPALVFQYVQKSGDSGATSFSGRKVTRSPLKGLLVVRASDGLPLRVTCEIRRTEGGHRYLDEGMVDYVVTTRGFVAPASVVHRGIVDDQLMVENRFTYAPFKTFAAETEIKFSEVPDSVPENPTPKP